MDGTYVNKWCPGAAGPIHCMATPELCKKVVLVPTVVTAVFWGFCEERCELSIACVEKGTEQVLEDLCVEMVPGVVSSEDLTLMLQRMNDNAGCAGVRVLVLGFYCALTGQSKTGNIQKFCNRDPPSAHDHYDSGKDDGRVRVWTRVGVPSRCF